MTLKYSKVRLVVFNEHPQEVGAFFCDAAIDPAQPCTQKTLRESVLDPMFNVVFSKMIPEMPTLSEIPSESELAQLVEWERTYYGMPC